MNLEQAVYGSQGEAGYGFLARSPGFADEWLPEAERLCTGFGERPAEAACPAAVFALPLARKFIAVVQVGDQGPDDAGRPGSLAFRLLVLPSAQYAQLGGDPFWIADQFPPPWEGGRAALPTGELPTLTLTTPPEPRRVADLQQVLNGPHSATLLGGVQCLLDGGRLAFERNHPEPGLVRGLWALLPTNSRAEFWPATYAFANRHHFHVAVVPRADGPDFEGYLHEAQAGDYPPGRYEHALQVAVEAGDQHEVDALLSRRSRSQIFRLAVTLLILFIVVPLIVQLIPDPVPAPRPAPEPAAERPDLPPREESPTPPEAERQRLAARLQAFGQELGLDLPADPSVEGLTESLAKLDAKLGTPDPKRDPGPLNDYGPLRRQLGALLWKHHVPEYNRPGLNTVELLEKLEKHVTEGKPRAGGQP